MARVIKRREDTFWYVPDIDDNREDSEPFMVLLTPLSGADMRRLESANMGKITKRGEINFMKRAQSIQERIISDRVLEVKNYAISDETDGSVIEPKNGAELIKAIMAAGASEIDILDDVIEALKDSSKLDEGMIENLRLQSDSATAEI